jgi:hypothetical protein
VRNRERKGEKMAAKKEIAVQPQADAKEVQALQKLSGLNERYAQLVNRNGMVEIKSKEAADTAGELATDYEAAAAFIDGLWREEAKMANLLHKSLTGKISKYASPSTSKAQMLRGGIKLWLLRETAKAEVKQEKINQRAQEEFSSLGSSFSAPTILVDKPTVAGFTPIMGYEVTCVDFPALLKAVNAKKAPPSTLTFNQDALDVEANEIAWNSAEVIDGKRYVYPGVIIERGMNLRRKPGAK